MDNKMNKPIALTPPMGWNSWNTFTWDINEKMICEMADRMVEDGYLEAGYEYLVIDDCWKCRIHKLHTICFSDDFQIFWF